MKILHIKGFFKKKSKRYPICVEDISKHGVKIIFTKKFSLKVNQIIKIEFTLNDPNESTVTREVRIKSVISSLSFGCEFLCLEHYGYLGKYFLSA
jgi:hypothetical protein